MQRTVGVLAVLGFVGAVAYAVVGAQAQASAGVYTDEQATRGQAMYLETCAVCHGDDLEGYAPNPPLSGQFFVGGWEGKMLWELFDKTIASMPATAPGTLTPEQTADIMAYVLKRNGYPAGTTAVPSTMDALASITVDAAPTAGAADGGGAAAATRTASEGVFSEEQIARGTTVYLEQCAACHGDYLEGSGPMPALAGPDFLSNWKGRTVGELFEKTLTTMPASAPGTMTEAQTAHVVAYMLSASSFPAGPSALEGDGEAQRSITLDAPPAQ
jgi:mono/diheme cytochrome c family protein